MAQIHTDQFQIRARREVVDKLSIHPLLERTGTDHIGIVARRRELAFQMAALDLLLPPPPGRPISLAEYLRRAGMKGLRSFAFVHELEMTRGQYRLVKAGPERDACKRALLEVKDVFDEWFGGEWGKSGNSIEETFSAAFAERKYFQARTIHRRSKPGAPFSSRAKKAAIAKEFGISGKTLDRAIKLGRRIGKG